MKTATWNGSVHPAAHIFPMLDAEAAAGLTASIRNEGLLHALTIAPDGTLLDGRNRLAACRGSGVEPRFVVHNGDPVAFIIASNLARRHLSTAQRALVAVELANLPAHRPSGSTPNGVVTVSQDKAASLLNVSARSVQRAAKLKREEPDLAAAILSAEVTLAEARDIEQERRKARDCERVEQRAEVLAAAHPLEGEQFRVFIHNLTTGPPEMEAPSIVVTDPPYPEKYLPLYGALDAASSALLPEGGSLLAMCGQSHLPMIYAQKKALRYQWTLGYFTPGDSTQVWARKVKTNWKPILWYVKGKYDGELIVDTFRSSQNNKRFHKWGQSVSGMAALIERFTVPGDLVYDPFCGGGTTGVAALLTGRLFVGSDIDEACVKQTASRLAEVAS